MCVQVDPGHGDFREHVGLHSGRENQAVRPGQQSALQTVQTGQTLTSTSLFAVVMHSKCFLNELLVELVEKKKQQL